MLARLVDHLWQSIAFYFVAWLLAAMLQGNSALLRTWLWRVAALKFVVPFALLYALGEWYGFPVRHSAIPPPAALTNASAQLLQLAAPARTFSAPNYILLVALFAGLVISAFCLLQIRRALRRARYQRLAEEARSAVNWEDRPAAPGFFKTVALTAAAALSLSMPFLAGALDDRQQRQAALEIDTRALHFADIVMRESSRESGPVRVDASGDHVEIHRINIKDLVALIYGVDQFEIFGGAMPWMSSPYYDVRVAGPIHAPRIFDPYSLREPVTKYLYEQYGVSIRINGACQEPCGDHESIVVERLARCANPLGPHLCRQ